MIQLKCCTVPSGSTSQYSEHVDQLVGVGLVQRRGRAEAEMMEHARRRIDQGEDLDLAGLVEGPQVLEQKRVVARLDANDIVRAGLAQVAQVWCVGTEGVFDDDDRQMGMLLAKLFQPAAGGVPLAVVLGLTVLLDDRLGCQRNDFLEIGMDQGGPQQLMGIGDVAVAMVLLQARGAMDLGGGEISCSPDSIAFLARNKKPDVNRESIEAFIRTLTLFGFIIEICLKS